MKTILMLTTLFCLAFTTHFIHTNDYKKITGTVLDEDRIPIPGAIVSIDLQRRSTITDSLGQFEFIVPKETTTVTIIHEKYASKKITLEEKNSYEIVLTERKIHVVRNKRDERIMRKSMPSTYDAMSYEMEAMPATSAPIGKAEVAEIKFSGIKKEKSEGRSTLPKSDKDDSQGIAAGQLTAGEWNDLANWEAWEKLIKEKDYLDMADYWQVENEERISVFVTNQFEMPIADAEVNLMADGKVIWASKTDNAGRAELWSRQQLDDLSIEIRTKHNTRRLSSVRKIKEGVNTVTISESCDAPSKAEIMFVVDATGSMGDEIEFLKSELKDVIDQVEANRKDVDFSWGSVFYRDEADDYLTRQLPLTSKPKRVLDFISMQSAGGGGDYPEAVNSGLEEALMQEWSDEAIARIVFLVLDAPPHHDPEVLADLRSQIAFAATRGIKIIPITASGINRQTEYLMKFMALMTNGTYVFLTDHSGIGNAHLSPIVKDFEVEKLNDLLTRLLSHYTDRKNCFDQNEESFVLENVEVFPNPTTDMIQVKAEEGVEKITLTTNTGKLIYSESIIGKCDVTIDLTPYIDGMYIVNFHTAEEIYSEKVVKMNRV